MSNPSPPSAHNPIARATAAPEGSRLPYQVSTLLYCFNEEDHVLLMHRRRPPNQGLWSPGGGKLQTACGESPYACACREAGEELGVHLRPSDLHLTGLVSEHGYEGQAHWLMFLFEVRRKLQQLPPPHDEGTFRFFPAAALSELELPVTDREQIWPLFWRHRGGFFSAHCQCRAGGRYEWTLEESISLPRGGSGGLTGRKRSLERP